MKLGNRSKQLRRKAIELSQANGGYHYGGSFSCMEILIALFDHVLKPEDKFVMSKGHSCWGYYALLQEQGFAPLLEGHPYLGNGVSYTSGSMGHGLPAAVGMALAKKIKKQDGFVYVLIGDGECQEGTTWESLLIAAKHNLHNLKIIIDCNGIQGSGYTDEILPSMKFIRAFKSLVEYFRVSEMDGHEILGMAAMLKRQYTGPGIFIANTIKGAGVSWMENKPEFHAKFLNPEMVELALEELA